MARYCEFCNKEFDWGSSDAEEYELYCSLECEEQDEL